MPDQAPPPRAEIETEDVEYASGLLARVYRPRGLAPRAALVEVHGGAWVNGDRLNNAAIDQALARAGFLVAALDFRMPPAHRYPAAVDDVRRGIAWLKARAAEFGLKPEQIGGLATSSGAQILFCAVLKPGGARLNYVISCWGVLDPPSRYRMAQEKKIQRFLDAHLAYFGDEDAMRDGSPQAILERGGKLDLPPALLIQGLADDNLDPAMAARFAESYKKAGGAAELHKFAGEPHLFITKAPEAPNSQKALGLIADFIARQTAL